MLIAIISGAAVAGVLGALAWSNWIPRAARGPWRRVDVPAKPTVVQRARIARVAHLALPNEHAQYYFAFEDDEGRRLRSSRAYSLEGVAPTCTWWSVTTYSAARTLPASQGEGVSINSRRALLDMMGRYRVIVSTTRSEGNWLSPGAEGAFCLVLRVFGPLPTADDLVPLPSIVAVS